AADEREVVDLEQEEIRRGVDAAECAIELRRRGRRAPLGPLRDDDLEDVALADVLLRATDATEVLLALREPAKRSPRAGPARQLRLGAGEERGHFVVVADEHLRDAAPVVKADEQ